MIGQQGQAEGQPQEAGNFCESVAKMDASRSC